jgi:hypothetical protein
MNAARLEAWGTFDVANAGDLLYPLVLEHELRARGLPGPIELASPVGGAMPLGIGRPVRRIATVDDPAFDAQAAVDGIVLGGGDIFRFLPADAASLIPDATGVYRYDAFIGELAVVADSTPVVVNGVGVPSPFTPSGARVVRLLARRARYMSVRDETSRRHLYDAGVDAEIAVVPDPALVLDRLFPSAALDAAVDALRARGAYPSVSPVLAFHMSFTPPSVDDELAQAMRALLDAHPDLQIALVPIGPCHGDVERMRAFAAALGPRAVAVDGDLTVTELVAAVAHADAFVGSSLHGNLIAARFCVPDAFLTLPSQRPHKLRECSATLGRADLDVNRPAELVAVARGLLDGRFPVDRARIDRLVADVDQHYDNLVAALGSAAPNESAGTTAPARLARAVASRAHMAPAASSTRVLAVERIRTSTLEREPFRWGVIDELFNATDRRALVDTYPVEPFATIEGHDGEKGYLYEARCLVAMGGTAPWRPDRLSEPWFRFASDLCSREYRAALSAATGIALDDLVMEANVFHYGPGAWIGPHVDLPEKVVTHVLYFNDGWESHSGGCLQVLRSEGRELIAEVAPIAGTSVVLVRSPSSWHAVTPVVDGSAETRRSVTVTFYAPGSVSTMWPPGHQRPLHRSPPAAISLAG